MIFLKVGAILLGGGYVILPILISELCKKHKLIEETELINYYTISQSLPGIVAANISMFAGYKLCGKMGAITATLGIITVPFLSIIALASIIESISENIYINGFFRGVGIAIIALIILTVREIWQKTSKTLFFYTIFFISLITILILNISPVIVIITITPLGIMIKKINKSRCAK